MDQEKATKKFLHGTIYDKGNDEKNMQSINKGKNLSDNFDELFTPA